MGAPGDPWLTLLLVISQLSLYEPNPKPPPGAPRQVAQLHLQHPDLEPSAFFRRLLGGPRRSIHISEGGVASAAFQRGFAERIGGNSSQPGIKTRSLIRRSDSDRRRLLFTVASCLMGTPVGPAGGRGPRRVHKQVVTSTLPLKSLQRSSKPGARL